MSFAATPDPSETDVGIRLAERYDVGNEHRTKENYILTFLQRSLTCENVNIMFVKILVTSSVQSATMPMVDIQMTTTTTSEYIIRLKNRHYKSTSL